MIFLQKHQSSREILITSLKARSHAGLIKYQLLYSMEFYALNKPADIYSLESLYKYIRLKSKQFHPSHHDGEAVGAALAFIDDN